MPNVKSLFLFLKPDFQQPSVMVVRFAIGTIIFFIGMGFIIFSPRIITPSLLLECVVFLGLILVCCGGGLALIAQLQLIIYRLFHRSDKR